MLTCDCIKNKIKNQTILLNPTKPSFVYYSRQSKPEFSAWKMDKQTSCETLLFLDWYCKTIKLKNATENIFWD